LFELFASVKPIQGDTVERIFYHILNEPLNMEPLMRAGAPTGVCDLVAHCTAKRPQERPQGFGPIVADLERMIEAQDAPTVMGEVAPPPVVEPPAPPPAAAARPAWMLPAAVAAVVVLGVGLYIAIRPKEKPVAPTTPTAPELAKSISTPTGEMVLVPAGDFLFGKNKETASLPPFYIDKTEVTNDAYARFCNQTKHPLPAKFAADQPSFPVVNVTVLEAIAFAKWAGKRLPNEKEWEKAARGIDGRTYPWGEGLGDANVDTKKVEPVTSRPAGASVFGALNMVGNVWEWVDQEVTPESDTRKRFPPQSPDVWYQIRGGCFALPLVPGVISDYAAVPASWRDPNIGFRCVKDAK